MDCNYNGACDGGVCRCSQGWDGDHCDMLRLLPTRPELGYQPVQNGMTASSWGGSVVQGPDGLFHMFAAEFVNNCGLNTWLSNSVVVHATSPDPLTVPFERRSVVRGRGDLREQQGREREKVFFRRESVVLP